jgi:hypothetical protein
MKFELKEHHRNTPETDLIADVISVSKLLGKETVTQEDYSKHGKYHHTTLTKRFKSWFIVLEKAGLKPARQIFDIPEEDLLKNIAAVWIKLGRQPINKDMTPPLSLYSGTTYQRHFGTWMNALKKFIEYENAEFLEEENEVAKVESINSEMKSETKTFEKDTRTISLRLRFSVFLRDGFRCTSCGKSPVTHPGVELHCDHILPWSKGGKTLMDNLKTLCADCNLGKGNMTEVKHTSA